VVAAADDDRAGSILPGTRDCQVKSAHDEPGAGKAKSVPGHGGGEVGQDAGLAGPRHGSLLDFAEVGREEGKAVGVVAEHVSLDKDAGDDRRLVGIEAGAGQEPGGKGREIGGGMAGRHDD